MSGAMLRRPARGVPVRFGIVGCGAISTQHAEAILAVPGAELAAVESAGEERARAAGERFGVPWGTDLGALLARPDIDAVSICTPSGLHAHQALAAIAAGKHVVVEKPIALWVTDADAIVAAAAAARVSVSTISQRRFEPVMHNLRDAVTGGAFGRPAMIVAEGLYHRPQSYYDSASWRGTRDLDGGVLMNQAIHMVDLLRWVGGPVASVTARIATVGHAMEAEDTATIALRFTSGAVGAIIATTCATPGFPQELRVYGDAGHARIVGDRPVEWVVDTAHWSGPSDPESAAQAADGSGGEPASPGVFAPATWGTDARGHIRQYADIVAAIREGRPSSIDGEEGRAAVEIVTAAYESDRTGRAVDLRRQQR